MIARQPQMLQMSAVETGQMSSVETGQMSAAETGQMSAVPESSGFAWACGVLAGAPRRGLTRGEESEEGGERALFIPGGSLGSLPFSMFLGGLKIDAKMVPKK